MGVGRVASWNLKFVAKKVVFLVLSGNKQISLILAPGKILEKSPSAPPPGKNLSDAHANSLFKN